LRINLKGSVPPATVKQVTLSGNQKVYGSLYAEDANITFTGGGGFQGNIITAGKKVEVTGGSWTNSSLFLAPNAEFTLGEGGIIKGSVIADSFTGTGGGSVTYEKTTTDFGSGLLGTDLGGGENLIIKESLIEK
jgi:hypothetical protein